MGGIITYAMWALAAYWIADGLIHALKEYNREKRITRIQHESTTPDTHSDWDCRSLESMASDSQNKSYSQHN